MLSSTETRHMRMLLTHVFDGFWQLAMWQVGLRRIQLASIDAHPLPRRLFTVQRGSPDDTVIRL